MNSGGGLSAQEYVDIQNLYARYNLMSDAGDAEGNASCFTYDGVLQIDPLGVPVQGRASFISYKQKDAAGRGGRPVADRPGRRPRFRCSACRP